MRRAFAAITRRLRKKKIVVPGEMENLILLQDKFAGARGEITVELEAEND